MDGEDLVHVLGRAHAVPHALGIDDHAGPELAAVEAARGVDADILQAQLLGARLHVVAQALGALALAAAARMALRPLVGAAEHMRPVEERRVLGLTAHERLSPPRIASLIPDQNAFWIW